MFRLSWRHYLAELECDILGHVPSHRLYHPLRVYNVYPDGTREKIADDTCDNCGHHIIDGVTRMRGE